VAPPLFIVRWIARDRSIDILEIIIYTFIDLPFNQSLLEVNMSPRGKKLNEQMRSDAMARITKAALEVFSAYGYYGSTMEKIMKASGLSKGLVYHYFPSKEKVFFHLVDSALEISRTTWKDAFDSPGTAWEKIEKLSENIVKIAFTDESSLYSLIMIQAVTEGKGIPGLLEHVFQNLAYYTELHSLIVEAQKSGEAAPGDADVLMFTYISLIQGLTLYTSHDDALRNKLTPDIFTNVLRNTGRAK
jgi:AcrR family transcriptional regulator